MKLAILEVLKEAGYIKAANVVEKDSVKKEIKIALEYTGKVSKVNGVKRLSKLGGRQYMSTKDIYKVRNGFGLLVLSTPKGIMSGAQARKENVGGEALFEIW
jgi:small subunit ribosomal protein S8